MKLIDLINTYKWEDIVERIHEYIQELEEWDHGYLPIHRVCSNECTPLHVIHAIINMSKETIKMKCRTLGRLPLHYAIRCSPVNSELIQLLVQHYPDSAITFDETGHTALTYHLWFKTKASTTVDKVVKILLKENKESIYISDKYGYTPLHHAARHCNLDICLYLINFHQRALVTETKTGLTPKDMVRLVDNSHELYRELILEEISRFGKCTEKTKESVDINSYYYMNTIK